MKKPILLLSLLLLSYLSNAQSNFKWDIADTVSKTKSEIYSDTKMFIAKTWKSAQNVIQNDDKESGIIIIRGVSIQKVNHSLNVFTYVYNYTVTFRMKDNKYRIIVENVYCESAIPVGPAKFDIIKIEPFDGEYVKGDTGMMTVTLPERKATTMMTLLKAELQLIVDAYKVFIKEESSVNDNW